MCQTIISASKRALLGYSWRKKERWVKIRENCDRHKSLDWHRRIEKVFAYFILFVYASDSEDESFSILSDRQVYHQLNVKSNYIMFLNYLEIRESWAKIIIIVYKQVWFLLVFFVRHKIQMTINLILSFIQRTFSWSNQ